MKKNNSKLFVISGASQSGKTTWTVRQIKKQKRVLVYDAEDQFSQLPGFTRITSYNQLLLEVDSSSNKKLAFVPSGDIQKAFNYWAACAFYWVRYKGPAHIVAEELADVSTPGKAPANWGVLIRRGLKRGATIYAISQRWAEADKTAVGNATDFIIFRSNGEDVDYLYRKTRIPVERLEALKPLQFIKKDNLTGTVSATATLKF